MSSVLLAFVLTHCAIVYARAWRPQHEYTCANLSRERMTSGRICTAARRTLHRGNTHIADRTSAPAALRLL